MKTSVLITLEEQLSPVLGSPANRVILEGGAFPAEKWESLSELIRNAGKEAFFALPPMLRTSDREKYRAVEKTLKNAAFSGFLARTAEEYFYLREIGIETPVLADGSIYAWNHESLAVLHVIGFSGWTTPAELSGKEISMLDLSDAELPVYGRERMMVSANCLKRTAKGCDKHLTFLRLKDRTRRENPVLTLCPFCQNILYNALPLCLSDCAAEIRSLSPESVRLSFTDESRKEVQEILALFRRVFSPEGQPEKADFPFTRGGFRNGTE